MVWDSFLLSFLSHCLPLLLLSQKLKLKPQLNQKLMLIQVPGTAMVDMVWDTAVDTTEDTTDIHTDTDTDTTVERDLLMLNQKQKLPLIQVPGTDMVDTTATHTDTEDTTEDIHTDTEVITAVDTTGVRF